MGLGGISEGAKGHIAMAVFSGLAAGSFSLGSIVAHDMDPTALTVIRFFLAGIIIGTAAAVGPGMRIRHFAAPWRYVILGFLFGAYFVLMFEGLKTALPVSTAAVFTLTPALTAMFGWLFLRQITTPRMALALVVGGLGALWVIFRGDVQALLGFDIGRGELLFFVGCVSHAAYTPLVRRFNRGEPALVFTFGMMVAVFIMLTIWGWSALWSINWAALPMRFWVVMGYLAVFSSAMTFVLLQYAALRLPSAKVMAYTYLVPSWVIVWEIALGHGVPHAVILTGVGLTIVALGLLLKDETREPVRQV